MRKWNDDLWLFTPEEFNQLPDGIVLTSINGQDKTKGRDDIDMDTRANHIAFGVMDPLNHPEHELFLTFKLKG